MAKINSKIKKIMLLTIGLVGGLIATSVAGITLSSCTFQVQQDPNNNNNQSNNNNNNNNNSSSNKPTSPKDELTYNPNANYYTTQIIFDANGNITNNFANKLTIDGPFIFADPSKSILIGMAPGVEISSVTIPSTVKKIIGYNAAVVYDTTTGKIVNPSFSVNKDLVLGQNQTLLDLGNVGAFQKILGITNGSVQTTRDGSTITLPKITGVNGLKTLTSVNFAKNSQLESIGPKAFLGCNNLTSVALPDSCNTIGAAAFQNCTSLQSINLKGVQYIGDAAFNNAFIASNNAIAVANPVTLNLSSAQYLGVGAFDSSVWTTTSTNASVRATTQVLPGTADNLTETKHLSKISSVTFGSKLNTLSTYAFNGANYLTSADLSSCTSLANISDNAFRNTANLTSVKFSNTIDTIGQNAFSGAPLSGSLSFNTNGNLSINQNAFSGQALTSIDFSQVKGNIVIGENAFSKNGTTNISLTSLVLPTINTEETPKSFIFILPNAFQNCVNLSLPYYEKGSTEWNWPANIAYISSNAFNKKSYETIASRTYNNSNPFNITSDFNEIANGLFAGVYDNQTSYLGPLLFSKNNYVKSVDLSNYNIQSLGFADIQNAINNNNNGSNNIGTFADASNLETITLPASCNQFGIGGYNQINSNNSQQVIQPYGAFQNCVNLKNLNFTNFKLNTTGSNGQTITPGFEQINQQTWIQVANIMNVLTYFGQQNIYAVAPSTVTNNTISTIDQMNGITYKVKANQFSGAGWWNNGSGSNFSGGAFQQSQNVEWWDNRYQFNVPINAYSSGGYGYTISPTQNDNTTTNPINTTYISYPAGLGTSVPAYINGSQIHGNNLSGQLDWTNNQENSSLQIGNSDATTGMVLQNGVFTENGSQTTDSNMNLVIPSSVMNTIKASAGDTKTGNFNIINDANNQPPTRPQSVWYTVSASGTISGRGDTPVEKITQTSYDLTADENNNIFLVNPNKIPGAPNNGNGSLKNQNVSGIGKAFTTIVASFAGGTDTSNGTGVDSNAKVFLTPDTNGLQTNNTTTPASPTPHEDSNSQTITIAQNYLPLGITANVKDAYFNHNGIIWHYHNGFVANDNTGIYIEGIVNSYIGGSIQAQNNGIGGLAIDHNSGSNHTSLKLDINSGLQNNGQGLTSVDFIESSIKNTTQNASTVAALFGGKVKQNGESTTDLYAPTPSNNIGQYVGPTNINVKLIIVPSLTK